LAVTAGVLLWLHRRRPEEFPFVRTALLLAGGLALVGFLVYPTAPPRLAGVGIVDTVSGRHVDLNCGLVSSLYNPYAALPSMHVGYALIVAGGLLRHGRRLLVRTIGALYALFVLLVIVATGNHFFLDAAAGRPGANRVHERTRQRHTPRPRPRQPQRVPGARAADERLASLFAAPIRELGHGIHDLPGFDTSDFRSFAVRLDPHETRLPIDRSAQTLLPVVEGTRTVVWRDTTRASTELGEGDTVVTNPPAVKCCARVPRAPASSRWRVEARYFRKELRHATQFM
jgi:PAP2 superfamily